MVVFKPQSLRFDPGLAITTLSDDACYNNLGSWCEDKHKRTILRPRLFTLFKTETEPSTCVMLAPLSFYYDNYCNKLFSGYNITRKNIYDVHVLKCNWAVERYEKILIVTHFYPLFLKETIKNNKHIYCYLIYIFLNFVVSVMLFMLRIQIDTNNTY